MFRALGMIYSLVCYAIGVAALVALILFIGDLFLPYTVNKASPLAPQLAGWTALAFNSGLIGLWGLQHTGMASTGFKTWWTRYMPAPIERSTYLVATAIVTAGLILFWAPVEHTFYDTTGTVLYWVLTGLFFFGWSLTLFATFLINHFHLFGLQQAWNMISKTQSKTETFRTPLLYKLVRHPMMTGMIISLWAAPVMTMNRLVLNLAFTAYILVGIYYEEKTLVKDLGQQYRDYRKTTPALVPGMPV